MKINTSIRQIFFENENGLRIPLFQHEIYSKCNKASKPLIDRMNYLWKMSHFLLTSNQQLAHFYSHQVVRLSQQNDIELPPGIETIICPFCSIIWIPGLTCSTRLRHRQRKSSVNRRLAKKIAMQKSLGHIPEKKTLQSTLVKNELVTTCYQCKKSNSTHGFPLKSKINTKINTKVNKGSNPNREHANKAGNKRYYTSSNSSKLTTIQESNNPTEKQPNNPTTKQSNNVIHLESKSKKKRKIGGKKKNDQNDDNKKDSTTLSSLQLFLNSI